MISKPPSCPYCGKHSKLVTGERLYPGKDKVAHKHFWLCEPCDAWVGCYENSATLKPVGRLANAELRAAKRAFHGAFDILWMVGYERLSRLNDGRVTKHDCISTAYKWLAAHMGINIKDCNLGLFDVAQCMQAKTICDNIGNELLHKYRTEGNAK